MVALPSIQSAPSLWEGLALKNFKEQDEIKKKLIRIFNHAKNINDADRTVIHALELKLDCEDLYFLSKIKRAAHRCNLLNQTPLHERKRLEKLPSEIIVHILSFLSLNEISKMNKVSTRFAQILEDPLNIGYLISYGSIFCKNSSQLLNLSERYGDEIRKLNFTTVKNSSLGNISSESMGQILDNCPNLRSCQLVGNAFDKAHYKLLTKCVQLEELTFFDCRCLSDDHLLEILAKTPNLKKLNVWGCSQLTDKAFESISTRCENLEFINLSFCDNVTRQGYASLAKCKELQRLIARFCQLTMKELEEIGKCSKLKILEISVEKLTDQILLALSHLPLSELHLKSRNPWIELTDYGLEEFSFNCHTLQHLNLENVDEVTHEGVLSVIRKNPSLQTLKFRSSKNINFNLLLKQLPGNCSLKKLISGSNVWYWL